MTDKRAGLEQIGTTGAVIGSTEVGAATGHRETGDRIRREAVIGADGRAIKARRRCVGAERRIAISGL